MTVGFSSDAAGAWLAEAASKPAARQVIVLILISVLMRIPSLSDILRLIHLSCQKHAKTAQLHLHWRK